MLTTLMVPMPTEIGKHSLTIEDAPVHPLHMLDVQGVPHLICIRRIVEEAQDNPWRDITIYVVAPGSPIDTGEALIAPIGSFDLSGTVLSYFMEMPVPPQPPVETA